MRERERQSGDGGWSWSKFVESDLCVFRVPLVPTPIGATRVWSLLRVGLCLPAGMLVNQVNHNEKPRRSWACRHGYMLSSRTDPDLDWVLQFSIGRRHVYEEQHSRISHRPPQILHCSTLAPESSFSSSSPASSFEQVCVWSMFSMSRSSLLLSAGILMKLWS